MDLDKGFVLSNIEYREKLMGIKLLSSVDNWRCNLMAFDDKLRGIWYSETIRSISIISIIGDYAQCIHFNKENGEISSYSYTLQLDPEDKDRVLAIGKLHEKPYVAIWTLLEGGRLKTLEYINDYPLTNNYIKKEVQ